MEDSDLKEKLPKSLKLKSFKLKGKKEYEEVIKNGRYIKGFFLMSCILLTMKGSLA